VKSLGLAYTHFGKPVPLFKRLGGRFFPKKSPFQRRVEKVGLSRFTIVFDREGYSPRFFAQMKEERIASFRAIFEGCLSPARRTSPRSTPSLAAL